METVFDPHLGKMVDRRTGMPVDGNTQPPARASTLDQIFNGTGIPERVNLMSEILNPMVNMRDAGAASQTLFDPDTTGWGRVGAFGNMASNMAAVLAPVMGAKAAGTKPVDAVVEALTNYSSAAKATGGEFLADELGGIKAPGYGRGITAYHGSPHSFDRFSMDKIGTGEGAQAYGHGLYFAENEGVAKGYRDALTDQPHILRLKGGDIAAAKDQTLRNIANLRDRVAEAEARATTPAGRTTLAGWQKQLADNEAALAELESGRAFGSMYEVRINANPDDFLDWDKPLSENSKARGVIEDALRPMLGDEGLPAFWEKAPTDGEAYTRAERALPQGQLPKMMAERGIPGIKYLDAGSRGAGDGSRNYVVFDENLIEIVKKYGIAGAAAMLGISAADLEASMQPQSMRDVLQ